MPNFNFGQVIIAAMEQEQQNKMAQQKMAQEALNQSEQIRIMDERTQVERDAATSAERWHKYSADVDKQRYLDAQAEARRTNPDVVGEDISAQYRAAGIPEDQIPAFGKEDRMPLSNVQKGISIAWTGILGRLQRSNELLGIQLKSSQNEALDALRKSQADAIEAKLAGGKTDKLLADINKSSPLPSLPQEVAGQGVLSRLFDFFTANNEEYRAQHAKEEAAITHPFGTDWKKNLVYNQNNARPGTIERWFTDYGARAQNAAQFTAWSKGVEKHAKELSSLYGNVPGEATISDIQSTVSALRQYQVLASNGMIEKPLSQQELGDYISKISGMAMFNKDYVEKLRAQQDRISSAMFGIAAKAEAKQEPDVAAGWLQQYGVQP